MKGEVGASRPHERGGWSSKGRFGGLKKKIWRKMKMKERLGLNRWGATLHSQKNEWKWKEFTRKWKEFNKECGQLIGGEANNLQLRVWNGMRQNGGLS